MSENADPHASRLTPHASRLANKLVAWPAHAVQQTVVAERAAQILASGGLVVFPTDTVYGLGASPSNPRSIERIYRVKGRPDEKAIIWLVDSVEAARRWCVFDVRAERLAARFWPGALTLVLHRLQALRDTSATLGVRVPAHPVALAIIRAAGGAVATTSANRSGEPSARSASDAAASVGQGAELIIDAGPAPGGTESTVLDLTADPPVIVRAGALSHETIASVLHGLS